MAETPVQVLLRLRRWVQREKSRYQKIYNAARDVASKERAFGEMNVCDTTIRKIDELRALEE